MKNRFFDDDIIFKKNEFTEAILQNDEFLLEEYHEHKKEYDDFFERFERQFSKAMSTKILLRIISKAKFLKSSICMFILK